MPRRPTALPSRRLPLALALLTALPALAQQAPVPLETITITATKRLQPLQSTPIAVSVLVGRHAGRGQSQQPVCDHRSRRRR